MPGFTRQRLGTQYNRKTGERLSKNEMLEQEAIDTTIAQGGDRFSYGDRGELKVHQPVKSPEQIGLEKAKEYLSRENEETYQKRNKEGVFKFLETVTKKGKVDPEDFLEYNRAGDHGFADARLNERGDLVTVEDDGNEIIVPKEKITAMLKYHAGQVKKTGARSYEEGEKTKYYDRQERIAKEKSEASAAKAEKTAVTRIKNKGGEAWDKEKHAAGKGWEMLETPGGAFYAVRTKEAKVLKTMLERQRKAQKKTQRGIQARITGRKKEIDTKRFMINEAKIAKAEAKKALPDVDKRIAEQINKGKAEAEAKGLRYSKEADPEYQKIEREREQLERMSTMSLRSYQETVINYETDIVELKAASEANRVNNYEDNRELLEKSIRFGIPGAQEELNKLNDELGRSTTEDNPIAVATREEVSQFPDGTWVTFEHNGKVYTNQIKRKKTNATAGKQK